MTTKKQKRNKRKLKRKERKESFPRIPANLKNGQFSHTSA